MELRCFLYVDKPMSDQAIILPPQPDTPPPPPNTVFRGPNGIRAGWRALIFLAIVAALAGLTAFVVGMAMRLAGNIQLGASSVTPLGTGLSESGIFLLTSGAALIMARIERRKYSDYGLPARFAFRQD